ncbi:MAG TPA: four helix bundle protein [Burkholderiales bacterium]|nr:four helix bundle protein [Burkholderiales bacterium]
MRRDRYDTRGHYDLDAWKVARDLVKAIYLLTQSFPRVGLFGLAIQMRRAAVSIPSNIAEGAARRGTREFAQFLNVARGSLSELETQLLIASDLAYVNVNDPVFGLTNRLARLLTGLPGSSASSTSRPADSAAPRRLRSPPA